MGAFKYVNQLWRKKQSDVMRFILRVRCWEYRQGSAIDRRPRPTRPQKARQLGYKAKQGFFVYRIRIRRGGRKKPLPGGVNIGKPASAGIHVTNSRNLQAIAETKLGKFLGAGVRMVNSYWVAQDAKYKYFEAICVDPFHPAVRADPEINWICAAKHKRREEKGKTSSGRKYRGLRVKGVNASKLRPSKRAVWKRHNTLKLQRRR